MPIPPGMPHGQGNPNSPAFYASRSRGPNAGGGGQGSHNNNNNGNGSRNNNRRRRSNNNTNGNQKYNQRDQFQDDGEFQPKLPSDTAPAYRFVERRSRRGKPVIPAVPEVSQQVQKVDEPVSSGGKTVVAGKGKQQENVTPKTLRIVSAVTPVKPGTSEGSAQAGTEFTTPSDRSTSNGTDSQPSQAVPKPKLVPTLKIVKAELEKDAGGVPLSWTTQVQTPTTPSHKGLEAITEEPRTKSIRELLDTSDIIEPALPKIPFLPNINLTPATPNILPSGVFSSPLTITKTPNNPNAEIVKEPTPTEKFLKIADVTSRYLNDRLGDINYNAGLSKRLKSDFEVLEAAYQGIDQERGLNPFKLVWNSLNGLKKAVEARNSDAKVLGKLKEMTMVYDRLRHEALHERRFVGETSLRVEVAEWQGGVGAVARAGEEMVDAVKWGIRGGDAVGTGEEAG